MIEVTNITRYDNVPFEEYLKMPGYSHSFLKREKMGVAEDLTMTDNIRLGSLVDALLTGEDRVDIKSPIYPAAREIALKIREKFESFIHYMQKQVSYTADMSHQGFILPVKGRIDFLLPNIGVVDLKVTQSKDIRGLIGFMGYKNQLWGYCKMAKVNSAYIMIYSVPLKRTEIIKIDCSFNENSFWREKILAFGKVAA
jgi:hypothetical protein